jgi:GH15 family glucan-1,4-alpha-glucosidase
VQRTNVLETVYRTKHGAVRVTDALTLRDGGLLPWVEIARRIEGLAGEVPMRWRVAPRFDWGRTEPTIVERNGVPVASGCNLELGVHTWDAGRSEIAGGAVEGAFTAREGSRALLAVCATHEQPIPFPSRDQAERRLDGTVDLWRRWLAGWAYDGPWTEHVARSVLALKLLIYAAQGSAVAAVTTSLPEQIGGDKNYDYRYMWVRDTSYVLDALMRLGLPEQVHESFCCLLRAVKTTAPDLHPFYSVEGRVAERFETLPLRGYRDSRPVRYGNAASRQVQLGSWGDLLETVDLYVSKGNALDRPTGELLADCVDRLVAIWQDQDSGVWELGDIREYTSSNIAVWTAFDRAVRLAGEEHLPSAHAARWAEEQRRVRAYVEERCWSDQLQSYVEYAGGGELDASILRAARAGWLRVAPERLERTVDAVRERLDAGGGLLYRTTRLAGEEGAFLACSFWLVDALARLGRVDEAAELFEGLLGYENDVGLLSEQIDPASGAFLGNFPQALSHLALINAAGAIQDARDGDASATAGAAAR